MTLMSARQVIAYLEENNISLDEFALINECQKSNMTREEITHYLETVLAVMMDAIASGLNQESAKKIRGKIIENEGYKLNDYLRNNKSVCGDTIAKTVSYALATMAVNISMGRVVASPTAGSCGVLPAVFKTVKERFSLDDATLIKGLLAANVVGTLIAQNATISGAEGGCQAEIGSASAMGAAAIVMMVDGDPEKAFQAAAISLKMIMGLVCDPIAGLVESPCVKRNAMGATNALISAQMAISGIRSVVPFDEVVEALYRVGMALPEALKETAKGGIAVTPTAIKIQTDLFY